MSMSGSLVSGRNHFPRLILIVKYLYMLIDRWYVLSLSVAQQTNKKKKIQILNPETDLQMQQQAELTFESNMWECLIACWQQQTVI